MTSFPSRSQAWAPGPPGWEGSEQASSLWVGMKDFEQSSYNLNSSRPKWAFCPFGVSPSSSFAELKLIFYERRLCES